MLFMHTAQSQFLLHSHFQRQKIEWEIRQGCHICNIAQISFNKAHLTKIKGVMDGQNKIFYANRIKE